MTPHDERRPSLASAASIPGSYHEEDTVVRAEPLQTERHTEIEEAQRHVENARADAESYRDLARRYRSERDQARARALAFEEELVDSKDQIKDLRDKIATLKADTTRPMREHTAETIATTATDRLAMNWRPRGIDKIDPLDGRNVDDYGPWRYSIDEKLETDAPLYPTERAKVRYAIAKMKNPIYEAMQTWVADTRHVAFDELMDEVEHFMGFHLQGRKAKKELQMISQKQGEGIDEFYHRIRPLWQKAKTPESDRVDQFLTTMAPGLSTSLLSKSYDRVRDLLDEVRVIEDRKKDVSHRHPRYQRGQPSTPYPNIGRDTSSPTTVGRLDGTTRERVIDRPSLNRKFGPVATKPEGWVGVWHDPENNPKRLSEDLKRQMQREGRCWACRGSGHRGHDSICPNKGKRVNQVSTQKSETESSDESENE
jgi:hypothetical protein